jgi:glycogen operon protein
VHHFLDEQRLVGQGRVNYWGYNSLAFFAPEPRYAARIDGQSLIAEFKSMVRTLHAAGLEVILDVVFNHTAETDQFGPTLSFRGIDNQSYYLLPPGDLAAYENYSGCGNTFNLTQPRVLQLVMDALRYWVGVNARRRLPLRPGRRTGPRQRLSRRRSPGPAAAERQTDCRALGHGPRRLPAGPLPARLERMERPLPRRRACLLADRRSGRRRLAQRLSGSSELFKNSGRAPQASVNFLTAHDGFTLRDLVSYQDKHNELNGEENRDGHGHNLSWNCGEEGESDDPSVLEKRRRLQRALLATLLIAQGVPMLQGGDELGRTQGGNNNAYCQDNEMTWLDWQKADSELIDYVAGLIACAGASRNCG